MSYATEADLDRVWGRSLIDLLTLDPITTQRVPGRVDGALSDAAAVMDGYISARMRLPIAPSEAGAALLRKYCCDIAVYELATSADRMTEIIQKRHEQAIQFLRDVAVAKADIPLVAAAGSGGAADGGSISPNEAVLIGNERVFTRDSLRGV